MKKHLHAHPIMILGGFKRYSALLAVPLIDSVVRYIIVGSAKGALTSQFIVLAAITAISVLRWRRFRIEVKGKEILAKKGILIRQELKTELSRVSCVSIRRGLFDFLFGSAQCRIIIDGEMPKIPDFGISLYKTQVNELLDSLSGGVELSGYVYFAAKKIYCEKERIGIIKLTRTPIDIMRGKCKLRFSVRSESADRVRMRGLDYKETIKMLNEKFNVEV